jgi:hypothetical protein
MCPFYPLGRLSLGEEQEFRPPETLISDQVCTEKVNDGRGSFCEVENYEIRS